MTLVGSNKLGARSVARLAAEANPPLIAKNNGG